MRHHLAAAFAAALLMTISYIGSAQLIEPKGVPVPKSGDTLNGFSFSFQHEITLFGEKFANDKRHYVNRMSGRITLGNAGAYNPDFELTKVRPHQMLHPSEVFGSRGIDSSNLWQGKLSDAQLTEMNSLVHANFWSSGDFTALDGHLFTWEEQRLVSNPEQSNTVQAAVIYNEFSTYVLYNYVAMRFLNAPNGKTMAGFSKAGSFESSYLPFSGDSIGQLPLTSGIGNRTLGRFIYRVDTWPPRRGGCLTAGTEAGEPAMRLASSVTRDSVLGGSLAVVSGRCPQEGAVGTCQVTMGEAKIAESPTVNCTECGNVFLACRLPAAYREGGATLSLHTNVPESTYNTEIDYVSPDEASLHGITLIGEMESWMKLSSRGLQISYNPAALRGDLKLRVIGYSESGLTQISATNSPMKILLEVPAEAAGQMDLSTLSCPADVPECDTHHLGFLEILDGGSPTKSIRSRILPLGWFVHKYYTDKQQPQWYRIKCSSLGSTEAQTQRVREQLSKLACPATLDLAKSDASRYLQLNYCPGLPGGCASATPKQQCFTSRPETNVDNHGTPASVCCYEEVSGRMLFQESITSGSDGGSSVWSQHGSRSIRSHPDGLTQSENLLPGQVSFMSHWYWDALQFLYCCRWSNIGDCPFYFMHERPTPKSSAYAAGRASTAVGDPHLTSYSGQGFLFNGLGEYWLLRSENFQVQGRFLKLRNDINATFLVALSGRVGNGPAFEASVLVTGSVPRFRVQRRPIGSEVSTEIHLSTDFPYTEGGVTIKLNQADNLVFQLASNARSVGIDMYAADGFTFMNAFVSLSDSMKGQTRGLLGRWTDDPAGEFVDIDDSPPVAFTPDASQFHTTFCVKNQLKNVNESLFNYDTNRANGFYQIHTVQLRDYRPVFSADGINPHGEEPTTCQSDKNCIFDLRVSQDVEIGRLTAAYNQKFGALLAAANSSDRYCDKPSVRGLQMESNAILEEDSSFRISCAAPLKSVRAAETVQCRRQTDNTLKWEPEPSTLGFECLLDSVVGPDPVTEANVGLIVGITVPVAILLIVGAIILVIVVRRRSNSGAGGNSGRPQPKPQQQPQQQQQTPTPLQTSRTTIVSSGADSNRGVGGDGYDNMGHGNRHMTPRDATADEDVERQQQYHQQNPGHAPSDDSRRSYDQSHMEPLDPAEFNPDEYAEPQRPQIGKSEVV